MELCWPKVGHTFKVSQHYQCVIYYCMFVLKSHVMEIKMIKTFHKGFINKNCKWLLCISHHELFIILLLKLPKKSFLDCSIKSACSTVISSYCSSTSSMGHSPLSNDHCYFDHPCSAGVQCTLSLPTLFLVALFLIALFSFTGSGILLVFSGISYCSLEGWLQVLKKRSSDVFRELPTFKHAFNPFDFAKGESLYLTQIKFIKDATTFIGQNACKDFSILSFNFSCHCLRSPFLNPPAPGFLGCLGSEFMYLPVLDTCRPKFYV